MKRLFLAALVTLATGCSSSEESECMRRFTEFGEIADNFLCADRVGRAEEGDPEVYTFTGLSADFSYDPYTIAVHTEINPVVLKGSNEHLTLMLEDESVAYLCSADGLTSDLLLFGETVDWVDVAWPDGDVERMLCAFRL